MHLPSWFFLARALILTPLGVQAQPFPAPASGDAPCGEYPRENVQLDMSRPDSEGFHSLFNGVDFSGWWLNCRSSHSQGDTGPIFRVDPDRKALYSTQRGNSGGVLMTKAKFGQYEIVFDYWPDWGNEAALQNRTDTSGRAYNTTLSYRPGTSLGGVWGEAGLFNRDFKPFAFGGDETTISIPGSGSGEPSNWTRITRNLKAAGEKFPCPEAGCTQADWQLLWDFDNWNQIRVIFRGGMSPNDPIHARSWFRKLGATAWVPLGVDTTLPMEIKPGYIGLMVHGGGRYGGPRGTWYRNIRWKHWTPYGPDAIQGLQTSAGHHPLIRVDGARHAVLITFADAVSSRDLLVLSLDGKSIAELRDIRGEALVNTVGWQSGVYLLRMETDGRREWARIFLP